MILVDTSIWADHILVPDTVLQLLIEREEVLCHSYVIGELAMGHLKGRDAVLRTLHKFPSAVVAYHPEVLAFVNNSQLFGSGLSYVDAHLLTSAKLTDEALLWTRDKRLHAAAERLGLAWSGVRLQ